MNNIITTLSIALISCYIPSTRDIHEIYIEKGNTECIESNGDMETYFLEYEDKCNLYLKRRCFKGTPLTGKILSECAKNTYDKYGMIVPFELALSQAQMESHMGTKGKSCKNNPYNVGEYDNKTAMVFSSTEKGVQAYFDLIASDYLSEKDIDELLKNFTNCRNQRYASSKSYERKISRQLKFIKKYIKKRC